MRCPKCQRYYAHPDVIDDHPVCVPCGLFLPRFDPRPRMTPIVVVSLLDIEPTWTSPDETN